MLPDSSNAVHPPHSFEDLPMVCLPWCSADSLSPLLDVLAPSSPPVAPAVLLPLLAFFLSSFSYSCICSWHDWWEREVGSSLGWPQRTARRSFTPLFVWSTHVQVPVQGARLCDVSSKCPQGEATAAAFGPHCPFSNFRCSIWCFVLLSGSMESSHWMVDAQRARISHWS